MSNDYTRGPWVWCQHDKALFGAGAVKVLSGESSGGTSKLWVSDADRSLIEASPDLLEALIWMVENDDTNEGDEPVESLGNQSWNDYNAYWIEGLNRARAAIAKATESKRGS